MPPKQAPAKPAPSTKPVPARPPATKPAPTKPPVPPKPPVAENPLMAALMMITDAIQQKVDPKELKKKDEEIAALKAQIEELKTDVYVQKKLVEEKTSTLYTYFKLNKELSDKLEEFSLTHYDKQKQDGVTSPAKKAMEDRMTAPAFKYTPGKRKTPEKEKSPAPSPKKKKTDPPSSTILCSDSEDDAEVSDDIQVANKATPMPSNFFSTQEDDIFVESLELLESQEKK